MNVDWSRVSVRMQTAGLYHWRAGVVRERSWPGTVYSQVLFLAAGGRARLHLHTGWATVERGRVFWLRPGWCYDCEQDPDDPIRMYGIHFDLLDAHGRTRPVTEPLPPEYLANADSAFVESVLRRLIGPISINYGQLEFDSPDRHSATVLFRGLLMELDAANSTETSLIALGPDLDTRQELGRIAAEMAQSPGRTPPIGELAARCSMSPSRFCQVFKKAFSHTPQRFLIMWRLRHAQRLLTETELSIKQISSYLGYENTHFFSRQFHQRLRQTPTEYRNAQRRSLSIAG